MDMLGFEEAWIGEHHSCGHELIPDPMIFIAYAANHVPHMKLGTGVVSLPYHNPLWVADRALFLDRLLRGRFMLGLGPGALPDRRHDDRDQPGGAADGLRGGR